MSRTIYRLIAALARLAFRSGRSKDLEIIVLRHQLGVLDREIDSDGTGGWTTQAARNLFLRHADQLAKARAPPATGASRGARHDAIFGPHRPSCKGLLQSSLANASFRRCLRPNTRFCFLSDLHHRA